MSKGLKVNHDLMGNLGVLDEWEARHLNLTNELSCYRLIWHRETGRVYRYADGERWQLPEGYDWFWTKSPRDYGQMARKIAPSGMVATL